MFCRSCGLSLVSSAKYCHNCGASVNASSSTSSITTAKAEPPKTKNAEQKPMTLSDFHRSREEARKKTFSYKSAKKPKTDEQDVTIQVGVMSGSDLKAKKGCNLPIKVSNNITAEALLAVAVEKHRRFNKDLVKRDFAYKLLYPDKSIVVTLPGVKEAFTLGRYKEELGKPYSRIIFYICDLKDYSAEKIKMLQATIEDEDEDVDEDGNSDVSFIKEENNVQAIFVKDKNNFPTTSCTTLHLEPEPGKIQEEKVQCPTCNAFFRCSDIATHADSCAESHSNEVFDQFYDDDVFQSIMHENNPKVNNTEQCPQSDEPSVADIVTNISKRISHASTSRINVRRGRLFDDYVETRTKFPWFNTSVQIKVTFMGEPAVDTGGPRREFLSGIYIFAFWLYEDIFNRTLLYATFHCLLNAFISDSHRDKHLKLKQQFFFDRVSLQLFYLRVNYCMRIS